MARVFLIHWHEAEAQELATDLRWSGHEVQTHSSTETSPQLAEPHPDVLVVSLLRLPSHGGAVAEWFWEAKKRRHLPIVFTGGDPEKVAAAMARFPRAVHCAAADLEATLATLQPPALESAPAAARPRAQTAKPPSAKKNGATAAAPAKPAPAKPAPAKPEKPAAAKSAAAKSAAAKSAAAKSAAKPAAPAKPAAAIRSGAAAKTLAPSRRPATTKKASAKRPPGRRA